MTKNRFFLYISKDTYYIHILEKLPEKFIEKLVKLTQLELTA